MLREYKNSKYRIIFWRGNDSPWFGKNNNNNL